MKDYIDIAADLIAQFEGFRPHAYLDPRTGGKPITIGYGSTKRPDGKLFKLGDTCTIQQATFWMQHEIEERILPEMEKIPTWGDMSENQKAALVSFAYNLGAHFYRGKAFASITRVCDQPGDWHDHQWVSDQFVKYRNPGSNVEAGLKRRRLAEAALFNSPPKGLEP